MEKEKKGIDLFSIDSMKLHWKMWLFPLAVVVFVVASLFVVLVPGVNKVLEGKKELDLLSEELDKLETKRVFLESLSEGELRGNLKEIERVLPSKKPVFTFVTALAGIAEEAELQVRKYSLSPGGLATDSAEVAEQLDPGVLLDVPIEVVWYGKFDSLMSGLQILNDLAPIVSIKSLGLGGDISKDEELKLDLEIKIHYSLILDEIGKVGDAIKRISPADQTTLANLDKQRTIEFDEPNIPFDIDQQKENLFEFR